MDAPAKPGHDDLIFAKGRPAQLVGIIA